VRTHFESWTEAASLAPVPWQQSEPAPSAADKPSAGTRYRTLISTAPCAWQPMTQTLPLKCRGAPSAGKEGGVQTRVQQPAFCKRLRVYRKLATRADHRTNPSATYISLGQSRRPSSTNLATTLELRPAMPAKPEGSGPTGAKNIKIRYHDDDQHCL
jgi:hypothetical protein